RALRRPGQRLGVARNGLAGPRERTARGRTRLLRPSPAGAERARPPGDQGRLAPVRAVVLPALPAGGPAGTGGAQHDGTPRLPVCRRRPGPPRKSVTEPLRHEAGARPALSW